jgi:hypothetical protein
MGLVNFLLLSAGALLLALALTRAIGPYARFRALLQNEENIRRYEHWRGGRHEREEREITGAYVMRQELRRQVQLWLAVALAGFVLVFLGFTLGR